MCGIVGVYNESRPAGPDIFVGAVALQHRGKESGGISVYDEATGKIKSHIGMGDMAQVFMEKGAGSLSGRVGIGHVRYSNTGSSNINNAQPVLGSVMDYENEAFMCDFMLGHNGQIINMQELLHELAGEPESENYNNYIRHLGDGYKDCSDTRVIADLMETSQEENFKAAFIDTMRLLKGAFCLVAICKGKIYAARDPHGVHPLQLGRRGDDYIIASESCAFDHLDVEDERQGIQNTALIRDILPGELIIIGESGVESCIWAEPRSFKFDIFEFIYFLRPESRIHGVNVLLARRRMGRYLAQEHPTEGLVVPVKSSGEHHAYGYFLRLAELGCNVFWEPDAIIRPNTVGRVWVEPYEEKRQEYLRIKFNVVEELVRDKEITLVDDSIVRGSTIKRLVSLCRRAGARKVHVRSGSDQYYWPDIYGNDTYKDYLDNRLIARRLNGDVERIAEEIGADSVGYLSLENTKRAILDVAEPGSPFTMNSFHDAVFTGEYALGTGDYTIL